MRPLFLEHGPNLPFGSAMDTRRSAMLVPLREMRVLLLDAFEALAAQRRLLRIANCRFHFALKVGRVRPARQRNNAVVVEHLGIEWVELRVPDVGFEHALFKVVEANRLRRAAEIGKGLLMQPAPDLRRRFPNDFAKGVSAVAQRSSRTAAACGTYRCADRGPALLRHNRPALLGRVRFQTGS